MDGVSQRCQNTQSGNKGVGYPARCIRVGHELDMCLQVELRNDVGAVGGFDIRFAVPAALVCHGNGKAHGVARAMLEGPAQDDAATGIGCNPVRWPVGYACPGKNRHILLSGYPSFAQNPYSPV
ncbi:MAG: hypothetical protein COV99_12410 [Bacteroidetes bacterium CG12_big_fil_rev_8_21_14_0_65_60_17]|nr:MAG: hypothetical protein COV99_12410 [Bacteroidetes bacterium CG12_big_fil_rev_8_21_14_0_65_60_17]